MASRTSGDDSTTIWLPNRVMRERATVPGVNAYELMLAVRGYMVPRYQEEMPDGRRVGELRAEDIQRVADGYACGECFAIFERRFEKCPGCSHILDPNKDIVDWSPDYWQPNEGRTSDQIIDGIGGM